MTAQSSLPLRFASSWQIHINGTPVGERFPSWLAAMRHLLDLSKPVDPTGKLDCREPNTVTIRQLPL